MERNFNSWLKTFRACISGFDYYVDFKKVYKNINAVKIPLNILNSLIGSNNIKEEFESILLRYPETVECIPLLLAIRERDIFILDDDGEKTYHFSRGSHTVQEYSYFMEQSGLFDLMQHHIISNLVDYATGIETGLDSNGRKNRGGKAMETLVGKYIQKAGFVKNKDYFEQFSASTIQSSFGIDMSKMSNNGRSEKRFDFVVKTDQQLYVIEANFYGRSGSKLNETARSYKNLANEIREIPGVTFVWFTDGQGWLKSRHNLEETFDILPTLYNIKDLENGIAKTLFGKPSAADVQTEFEFCPCIAKDDSDLELPPKPFVKWVGGKTQLLSSLASRLPETIDSSVKTYIEPFVGGGAFFFWLLGRHYNFERVIINDANKALISAYKTVRDVPDALIELLAKREKEYGAFSSEDERMRYYYSKREEFNTNQKDPVNWAANFIFLNRTCFNGLYRVNAKGFFNVPHGRYSKPMICDPETIYSDSKVLRNVDILNVDFEKAVSSADEHSFVYFDPPYRPLSPTSNFCSYCEGGFDDNEQKRLATCCRELDKKGCKWLLSNSDPKGVCPEDTFFEKLYEGFNIQSVQASRMLNANPEKRGKLSELLISNY